MEISNAAWWNLQTSADVSEVNWSPFCFFALPQPTKQKHSILRTFSRKKNQSVHFDVFLVTEFFWWCIIGKVNEMFQPWIKW